MPGGGDREPARAQVAKRRLNLAVGPANIGAHEPAPAMVAMSPD
jgi:hypothetical protein